ncbi:hypothetical protein F5Y00DRAFT_267616 [Daldinia vernicosa]|uniref:uncharacterized protein n=1 Tax=Daldinia vernicosa TaxID=114800 RepID=UPI002008682F|nr:uncharacterized protein F5Y00DRAFT_267616 [Daldinia vernicosa]KAI0854457.1 hypothetical protein F5Y00DRAFT_267616 [Daldinia vernicosa]
MAVIASQRPGDPSGNPPLTARAVKLIIIISIFIPFSILAVALRLWARKITGQNIAVHDWAIVAASIFNCGHAALNLYISIAGGSGYHIEYLIEYWPVTIPRLYKAYLATEPLWTVANSLIKISILHFYVTIFPNRRFHILCYIVMGLIAANAVCVLVRMFFFCTPFEATWNPDLFTANRAAHCINLNAAYLIDPIINMVFDIIVFFLPLPQIWRLRLEVRKKLMLIGIFTVGLLICIITSLRIWTHARLPLSEIPYQIAEDGIWAILEPCLGIINACLPLLRPLGTRFSSVLTWGMFSNKACSSRKSAGTDFDRSQQERGEARGNRVCIPLHEVSISTTEPSTRRGTIIDHENEISILPQAHNRDRVAGCILGREAGGIRVTVEWEVQREG